jgi:hypothetical protein
MSKARALIEALGAAPAVEPRPGTKPSTAPGRPAPAAPRRPSTNPFRRRDIRPGEEPRPKAMETFMQEGKGSGFRSSEKASLPGKAKKMISSKSSGTGASGLSAKKAFKK